MASTPVTVTVTGAAGQIGYALLFRIASGQLLGPDTPVRLRLLEIPQAVKAAEGTAMELDDCAFPLLDGVDIFDDADGRVRRAPTSRCSSAPGRAPRAWSAATCSRPTAASSSRRARRSTPAPPTTSACSSSATRPTPTRSSRRRTRPTCPRERFTAMTRLDHNRALSQLATKAGVDGRRHRAADDLGQPLGDPVPGHRRTRRSAAGRRSRSSATRRGCATRSSRRSPSAARRSSRPAARRRRRRRRTRPSTTCTTGCTARPRATGPRPASSPTAPTACPRGSSPRSR